MTSSQASTRGDVTRKLQPTTWRLFEDIRLVVPIYGRFTVLEHLFIFFFFGLAMTRRLGSNSQHIRYEHICATVHARRLFPAPSPDFWLFIKYSRVFGVACSLGTASVLVRGYSETVIQIKPARLRSDERDLSVLVGTNNVSLHRQPCIDEYRKQVEPG